jgi:predicted house-cleaning noncanonical NTP pyrophosphatase (MazG superfamily)
MAEKLVRDLIPRLYPDNCYRKAHAGEMGQLLVSKLVEEAMEVAQATTPEEELAELADLMQTLLYVLRVRGLRMEDLEVEMEAKALERGVFQRGWVMTEYRGES